MRNHNQKCNYLNLAILSTFNALSDNQYVMVHQKQHNFA